MGDDAEMDEKQVIRVICELAYAVKAFEPEYPAPDADQRDEALKLADELLAPLGINVFAYRSPIAEEMIAAKQERKRQMVLEEARCEFERAQRRLKNLEGRE